MKPHSAFVRLLLAGVAILAAPALVLASEPTASVPMENDSTTLLGELNVVALKQSEMLRDDALSSSVLGRMELEQLNVSAIKGVADVVPNLFIPEYGSRITSTIYLRGIGTRMDQPSVGLTVDNVPFLNKNAYDFDLSDIASVEVMRGPQSTLYGRNTIGGMINITTISPMRWQGWRISASGATGNDWKASVGWYGKAGKRSATSLMGSFSYLGGFYTNAYNGKKTDHELSGALRWKWESRLSSSVTLRNVASASLLRQGGYPYKYVPTGEISYNDTCFYRRFLFNDGLTVNWRTDHFTMTSITSVQHLDDNMTLDQDFLPLPYFTLTQKQKETGFTQDLLFRGKASEKYRWTAGVFGFFKSIDMQAPVTFGDTGIAELIEKHRNDANPDYPIEWNSRNFTLGSDFRIPTGGVAVYHESEVTLGDWKINAGLRLDWEQSRLRYRSTCHTGYQVMSLQPDGSLTPYRDVNIDIDDSDRISRDYFNWTPSLSLLYSLPMEGENNLYLSVAKGWKSGGFNTQMFSEVLQQRLMSIMGIGSRYDVDKVVGYKPEYSWNYELGAHLSFPKAALSLDLSAFYIDCRDQQLTMFPAGTTTGRIMTNAGRTRSVGAEFSLQWRPLKQLSLAASYGYTNAKFREFFNGIENFRGKYVPYAPQNTMFLSADYRLSTGTGFVKAVTFQADVRANGPICWNESNSLRQDLYALLGASIQAEGEKWSLQVWGRNLTGTRYDTFYFMSMGNEFLQRGRPMQIGATLRLTL